MIIECKEMNVTPSEKTLSQILAITLPLPNNNNQIGSLYGFEKRGRPVLPRLPPEFFLNETKFF